MFCFLLTDLWTCLIKIGLGLLGKFNVQLRGVKKHTKKTISSHYRGCGTACSFHSSNHVFFRVMPLLSLFPGPLPCLEKLIADGLVAQAKHLDKDCLLSIWKPCTAPSFCSCSFVCENCQDQACNWSVGVNCPCGQLQALFMRKRFFLFANLMVCTSIRAKFLLFSAPGHWAQRVTISRAFNLTVGFKYSNLGVYRCRFCPQAG